MPLKITNQKAEIEILLISLDAYVIIILWNRDDTGHYCSDGDLYRGSDLHRHCPVGISCSSEVMMHASTNLKWRKIIF